MIAIALAVIGLVCSTVSLRPYQTALSITKVVPPTTANFSSSRCLTRIDRSGSGTRASTLSTTVTSAVYEVLGGAFVRVADPLTESHHPRAGVGVREHPLLERPQAEDHGEPGAEQHPHGEVGDLLNQQAHPGNMHGQQVAG